MKRGKVWVNGVFHPEAIKSKLITPEKIGARTREEPFWDGNAGGEDGGI